MTSEFGRERSLPLNAQVFLAGQRLVNILNLHTMGAVNMAPTILEPTGNGFVAEYLVDTIVRQFDDFSIGSNTTNEVPFDDQRTIFGPDYITRSKDGSEITLAANPAEVAQRDQGVYFTFPAEGKPYAWPPQRDVEKLAVPPQSASALLVGTINALGDRDSHVVSVTRKLASCMPLGLPNERLTPDESIVRMTYPALQPFRPLAGIITESYFDSLPAPDQLG